jgi:hypothetical protein
MDEDRPDVGILHSNGREGPLDARGVGIVDVLALGEKNFFGIVEVRCSQLNEAIARSRMPSWHSGIAKNAEMVAKTVDPCGRFRNGSGIVRNDGQARFALAIHTSWEVLYPLIPY